MLNNFRNKTSNKGLFTALLLITVSMIAGCKSGYVASGNQDSSSKPAFETKQVKTVRVTEKPLARSVTVTGALAAYDQATLSVKVPGRLKTISVDLGSVIHQGQLIAQIEVTDY